MLGVRRTGWRSRGGRPRAGGFSMDQQTYQQMLAEVRAIDSEGDERTVVARAAGLLAGRVGCRVREAHVYLLSIAQEQGREPVEVAADILRVLEARAVSAASGSLRSTVAGALREVSPRRSTVRPAAGPGPPV